jgi:integrase
MTKYTDAQVARLPIPAVDRLVAAGDPGSGLYLRLRATGARVWLTRRRVAGKWIVDTIGSHPQMTAATARRVAAAGQVRTVAATTFEKAAATFFSQEIETRYRSAAAETKHYLGARDCGPLLRRRLDQISRGDVAAVIRAKKATAPNAAAKLLSVLKQFFAWAQIGGLIEVSPAAGLTGRALKIPTAQPRERTLTPDEIRALWAWPDEPYGRLLRFTLLTACRIGEAIQFEPGQIDAGGLWTIPQTKNGKPHSLPLAPLALELAKEGWPKRDYQSVYSALRARRPGWNIHDLRRTAASLMADAGVSVDVIERVLNHARPKLIATYHLSDPLPPMRDALQRLEVAVLGIVT